MHLAVLYPALEVEARPHDLRHELLRRLATAAVVIVAGAAPKIVSRGSEPWLGNTWQVELSFRYQKSDLCWEALIVPRSRSSLKARIAPSWEGSKKS